MHTERQAKLVRGLLGHRGIADVDVAWAMRYGQPTIAGELDRLRQAGARRIVVVPLYPQFSASTTLSTRDALRGWRQRHGSAVEILEVEEFHEDPGYIGALRQSMRDHWMTSGRPDHLVMSFHGLPRYSLDKGDPYHCECQKTGRLLAEALGLAQERYQICFQSRFGRAEWLQPYTAATLQALGKQGLQRVDVICPGFPADCLETLEEIAIEGKSEFMQAGGKEYCYVPCLNERDDWMHALTGIATSHLQGWPTQTAPDAAGLELSALRARAMGAPF